MISLLPSAHPGARRGLTLVEVTLSMAIASMVMVAIGSAILLAGKAIPDGESAAERTSEASRIANQIAGELRAAVHITERTAHAITFTLADRNGDGLPEVIRYSWSGVAGESLYRRQNGSAAVGMLENVHDFDLDYERKSVTETYPGPLLESAEVLLNSYDGNVDLKERKLEKDNWIGQYFKPSLPASAVSWRVSRVLFAAKYDGPIEEEATVQIRLPDSNNKPSGTVLEQQTLYESDLFVAYTWREFSFSSVTDVAPDIGLCLVLKQTVGGLTGRILYESNGGSGMLTTDDAGDSWTSYDPGAMKYYVYGTVTSRTADQTATRDFISAVRIGLQTGADPDARVETAVHTPNAPEALSGVWEADFLGDPTRIDLDADDAGDWVVGGGGTFDAGWLVGGVFEADAALETHPGNDFAELTTAEVSLRDTLADGQSGGLCLRVDRTGDTYAYIRTGINKLADGTQTLTIWTYDPGGIYKAVHTETGLPSDFVDLRLVVDPGKDTVHVRVNGVSRGTYEYGRISAVTDPICWLYETAAGSGVQFARVCIRLGGSGS